MGIFYEGPDLPLAEGYLGAHYIENLLGHFGLRGEMIRMADYRPGQAARYRAAFYIGSVPSVSLPRAFLKDVMSSRQPFCWLGLHIEQLLQVLKGAVSGSAIWAVKETEPGASSTKTLCFRGTTLI